MARMLGKAYRPLHCEYGCCVPDHGHGRRVIRRARAIEKRSWSRALRRSYLAS